MHAEREGEGVWRHGTEKLNKGGGGKSSSPVHGPEWSGESCPSWQINTHGTGAQRKYPSKKANPPPRSRLHLLARRHSRILALDGVERDAARLHGGGRLHAQHRVADLQQRPCGEGQAGAEGRGGSGEGKEKEGGRWGSARAGAAPPNTGVRGGGAGGRAQPRGQACPRRAPRVGRGSPAGTRRSMGGGEGKGEGGGGRADESTVKRTPPPPLRTKAFLLPRRAVGAVGERQVLAGTVHDAHGVHGGGEGRAAPEGGGGGGPRNAAPPQRRRRLAGTPFPAKWELGATAGGLRRPLRSAPRRRRQRLRDSAPRARSRNTNGGCGEGLW